MDKFKGRVIITYGRSVMALTAAHSLRMKNIEVIGCDDLNWTILSFSKYSSQYFVHPPHDDLETFLDFMEEKIIELKPEEDIPYVLMPIHRLTPIFAEHRERFERHIKVAVPTWDAMQAVHPKDNFALTAKKAGIHIPETLLLPEPGTLTKQADKIEYPALIKPVDATGGRGIAKVDNPEDLLEKAEEIEEEHEVKPLVQELVTGEDYCYAGIFDRGKLVTGMAYTNVYKFPEGAGAGVFRETVDDTPFRSEAEKLMKRLKWHGIAEIDFMWDGSLSSTPYMIEVNARFWGGLFQSVESGVDFPWLLYRLTAEGKLTEAPEPIIGTRTKIPFLWLTSALKNFEWDRDEIQETLSKAEAESKEKNTFAKIGSYMSQFAGSLKIAKNIGELRALLDSGAQAKSEPFYEDDPMAVLGMAFVLHSLLVNGELPPEIKF